MITSSGVGSSRPPTQRAWVVTGRGRLVRERRLGRSGHLRGRRASPRARSCRRGSTSPGSSTRASADLLVVHERPVRRPEVLDRQPSVGAAGQASVASRDLRIAPEPPLVLGGGAPEQQVGVDAEQPALVGPLDHAQLLAGHRGRSVTASRASASVARQARRRPLARREIMGGCPRMPAPSPAPSRRRSRRPSARVVRFWCIATAPANSECSCSRPASTSATVGRRSTSDLVLDWDEQVSRLHARFERADGAWVLVDDGLSSNGTFVNEQRVNGSRRLTRRRQHPVRDDDRRVPSPQPRQPAPAPVSAPSPPPPTRRARAGAGPRRGLPVEHSAARPRRAVPAVQGRRAASPARPPTSRSPRSWSSSPGEVRRASARAPREARRPGAARSTTRGHAWSSGRSRTG